MGDEKQGRQGDLSARRQHQHCEHRHADTHTCPPSCNHGIIALYISDEGHILRLLHGAPKHANGWLGTKGAADVSELILAYEVSDLKDNHHTILNMFNALQNEHVLYY